jgi:putative transposase
MKWKRFSIEQILAVLNQAELGMPVADVIRQVGISEQTFDRWYGRSNMLECSEIRCANSSNCWRRTRGSRSWLRN